LAIETGKNKLAPQNRWLLVEFIHVGASGPSLTTPSPEEISTKDIFNALKQSVLLHFGDVGWGEVGASLAGKSSSVCFAPVVFPSAMPS
jgi:hypothetical protein